MELVRSLGKKQIAHGLTINVDDWTKEQINLGIFLCNCQRLTMILNERETLYYLIRYIILSCRVRSHSCGLRVGARHFICTNLRNDRGG